jgi:hypothetical protein
MHRLFPLLLFEAIYLHLLFQDYLLRAQFGLPSIVAEESAPEKHPPIRVKFEIPYFTVSGIQVKAMLWKLIFHYHTFHVDMAKDKLYRGYDCLVCLWVHLRTLYGSMYIYFLLSRYLNFHFLSVLWIQWRHLN